MDESVPMPEPAAYVRFPPPVIADCGLIAVATATFVLVVVAAELLATASRRSAAPRSGGKVGAAERFAAAAARADEGRLVDVDEATIVALADTALALLGKEVQRKPSPRGPCNDGVQMRDEVGTNLPDYPRAVQGQ